MLLVCVRVVQALVVGASSAALAYHTFDPSWQVQAPWQGLMILALVGAGVVPPLLDGFRELRIDRLGLLRQNTDQVVRTTFTNIAERCLVDWRQLRVNVYVVRRSILHPKGYLDRFTLLRMTSSPPPSRIRWRKGKGIVGRCWRDREVIAENVEKVYKPLRNCDETTWDSAPESTRMDMKFDEFRRVQDYGVVVAVPMYRRGRVWGVLSIDAPSSAAKQVLGDKKADMLEFMQLAADTIPNLRAR